MGRKTWKVIEWGDVPEGAPLHDYTCMGCGREALCPMRGLPLAQIEMGIVFDIGSHALPEVIQCRGCRRRYGLDARAEPTAKE